MEKAIDTGDETGPERTCIVTRAKGSPERMIRFVPGPGGEVTPDLKRKLPGRGVWVTASATTLAEAVRGKAFSRAFRGKAEAPATLVADVDALMEQDVLQWLSLANKAGLVIAGFAKVETAIGRVDVAGLVHASDAGDDGVRKLGQAVTRRFGQTGGGPSRIRLFVSSQLDLALGRPHVIHAALLAGAATNTLLSRCTRLALFRGTPGLDFSGDDAELRGEGPLGGSASTGQTNGLGPRIEHE